MLIEIINTIIAIFVSIVLIKKLKNKYFWDRGSYYKFPIIFIAYIFIINIPPLFGFGGEIHTPLSIFYILLNLPVLYIFDVDKMEIVLFGEKSLRNSNMTFSILSISFWGLISLVSGIVLFVRNIYFVHKNAT